MKNIILGFLICPIFIFVLSGCVSITKSPSPRFYKLGSISQEQAGARFKATNDGIIGVGPVKIPEYLNRPQIVTVDNNNMVNFAQFDRWGEPLDFAIARILDENLSVIVDSKGIEMFPWSMFMPVRFQVVLDIVELDVNMSKDLVLTAQWSILDLKTKSPVFSKRSLLIEDVNPHNYSGVVAALNTVLSKISIEIGQELSRLPVLPGVIPGER
ncbi:MAG: PqiC family protein [Candidatus Omnitrophota bacterium]